MRYLGVVKDDAIFEFAGISKYDAVADDDVFAYVAATAYFAVVSDPGRAFDGRSVLDQCATADVDIFTDKRSAHDPAINSRFEAELKIAANLLQDIPYLCAVVENSPMLCLIEIKKIRWRKHKGFKCASIFLSVSDRPWCL